MRDRACQISLGEGWTPLLDAPRVASRMGVGRIWVKDEGQNPTGSFKDRGLCLAVSRAKELGATELALPSAGNAGGAAAAYGALAGMAVDLFLPDDTPQPFRLEAIGNEEAIEILKQGIAEDDPEVRFYSAEALAYLDNSDVHLYVDDD